MAVLRMRKHARNQPHVRHRAVSLQQDGFLVIQNTQSDASQVTFSKLSSLCSSVLLRFSLATRIINEGKSPTICNPPFTQISPKRCHSTTLSVIANPKQNVCIASAMIQPYIFMPNLREFGENIRARQFEQRL